jgi:glutamate dehydrogenase/leucine dehydrogenase
MAKHCQYILGLSTGDKGGYSTSKTAARGVFYAIKAAARHRYGSDGLKGRVVGVKGVGKLGEELVRLLIADGARVLIADTDHQKTVKLKQELTGIEVVEAKDIHKQEMDIYAPCALGDEFKPAVIKELACDIVAGGANNQLPNVKAGDELHKRDILYVPDYIANAGGLIFVSEDLESDGFHLDRVLNRLENIQSTLAMVFERSEQSGLPTHRVADAIAQERISKGNV